VRVLPPTIFYANKHEPSSVAYTVTITSTRSNCIRFRGSGPATYIIHNVYVHKYKVPAFPWTLNKLITRVNKLSACYSLHVHVRDELFCFGVPYKRVREFGLSSKITKLFGVCCACTVITLDQVDTKLNGQTSIGCERKHFRYNRVLKVFVGDFSET